MNKENDNFTDEKYFIVTYVAVQRGDIIGKTMQSVRYGESGAEVTAVADYGYEFKRWSDGVTKAARVDFAVIDKALSAESGMKAFNLQYGTDGNGVLQGETSQTVEHLGSGTAVTAIPSIGYEFAKWSDGVMVATRTDIAVTANIIVFAIFKKQTFIVRYESENSAIGLIADLDTSAKSGWFNLPIEYGEAAPHIVAVPKSNLQDEEYIFLGWSDGVTTLERRDTNITSDVTYVAYFGYKIDYIVNGGVGGRIEGNAAQRVLSDEMGTEVTAVADNGYVFMGWSDLSWEPTRQDKPDFAQKFLDSRHIELIAYFEPITKTFAYDYGFADGIPSTAQITIDRNALDNAEFVIPERKGYTFCGWYADSDYRIRITTDTGRYMYGYAAFALETDTLYARWERNDERTDNHKILMIFIDEVQATLYSEILGRNENVSTKMTALDYELCEWTASTMYNLLNEWFDGKVIFEVDSYYSTKTITNEFQGFGMDYYLFAGDVNEVSDVVPLYHNTLTVVGIGDFDRNLIATFFGLAYIKDAFVTKDDEWSSYKASTARMQEHIEALKNGEIDLNETIIRTCLHELIHTAEMYFDEEYKYDLHNAIGYAIHKYGISDIENTLKPCLLGEFEIEGETCGIPINYWKHNMDIHISYVCRPVNVESAGEIRVVGEKESVDQETYQSIVSRDVVYGTDFSVEAVPKQGYRFVGWSDGVATAIRKDKNIIAYCRVEAIFEKI